MKITTVNYIRLVILMILLTFSSASFSAKFFRWTDENGKTHYSYNLPPSVSQQGYTKINKNGRHVEQIDSQEKELAEAEAKAKETAKRQEEAIKKEQEKEAEETMDPRDKFLLDTYVSVEEVTAVQEEKILLIRDQIVLYTSRIAKLEKGLADAKEQIKLSPNQTVQTRLKDYIQVSSDSLAVYKEMIHDSTQQIEEINKNYDADKQRLSELLSQDNEESSDEEAEETKQ